MHYNKIKVPFLKNTQIKSKAELFRKKFWDDSIPVDIEYITDVKLKLDIVPTKGLQEQCDTDALIGSNWQLVYIDHDRYLDNRYQNRLRFSLAHEMGHFVLHKGIYSGFKIKGLKDFRRLLEQIPSEQYGYLEVQANKFANYLLVPRERLISEKNKVFKKYKNLSKIREVADKKTLNSYLTVPISKIFGVSESVIEIALNELDSEFIPGTCQGKNFEIE